MMAIDSVLLNLTERSCRAFQKLTGKTNVWLAVQLTNLSIVMYFVWAALWTSIIGIALQVLAGLFGAALLYVLTQTVFKVSIEAYETAAYRRVDRHCNHLLNGSVSLVEQVGDHFRIAVKS